MKQIAFRCIFTLVAVGFTAFEPANLALWAADGSPARSVVERISAKDFWEQLGSQPAPPWTEAESTAIRSLATTSNDPVVRLRAHKLLVDAAGNGRLNTGPGAAAIATAAFRYLEEHLDNPSVKDLCVTRGFTHYHVSSSGGNAKVFLIERVGKDFNGGINLRWNETNQTVARFEVWGEVALR